MKRIDNLAELRKERARLKLQVMNLEQEIKNDVEKIKHDLKPANIALKAVNNLFHRSDTGLGTAGLNIGIDMLLRNVFLRNAGWIYKMIVPYFVKNVTSNYVADHNINIIDVAKTLFNKWRNRNKGSNHSPLYDKATADINY